MGLIIGVFPGMLVYVLAKDVCVYRSLSVYVGECVGNVSYHACVREVCVCVCVSFACVVYV